MTHAELLFSPAAERNKGPILQALRRLLPPSLRVLEIASGTGQHAQHFASLCPGWVWQPTESEPSMLPVIDARCRGLANVLPAVHLDVEQMPWSLGSGQAARYGAVYCANLLHIAPWSACPALMQGVAAHLVAGGLLLLYGPYRQDGVPTAPSNEAFDADLKSRNAEWGLRSLAAVEREAATVGLVLHEVVAMPANNLLLVFRAT
jgi:SAM-dependent methyltransferase